MGALSENSKRLPTLQFGHKFHLKLSNFTFSNKLKKHFVQKTVLVISKNIFFFSSAIANRSEKISKQNTKSTSKSVIDAKGLWRKEIEMIIRVFQSSLCTAKPKPLQWITKLPSLLTGWKGSLGSCSSQQFTRNFIFKLT